MSRLLLVRHATHTAGAGVLLGRIDPDLSERGREEARLVARRLAPEKLDAVYTSPLRRAHATAAAVAQLHGLAPVVVPALTDIDYGGWAGRELSSLADDDAWRRWNSARAAGRPPGGETMTEVCDRLLPALAAIAAAHPAGTVAVVTHCDLIRACVLAATQRSLDEILSFEVDMASITEVTVEDQQLDVRRVNDVTHLRTGRDPTRAAGRGSTPTCSARSA